MTSDSKLTILVPTRNRPAELARLLGFLAGCGYRHTVVVLDGSSVELQSQNSLTCNRHAFVRHWGFPADTHPVTRLHEGLKSIDSPLVMYCADDDFVFPVALDACATFLRDHADHSAALGRVYSLNYRSANSPLRHGIYLRNPFDRIGYAAQPRFLQRALYFDACVHLGTPPLFYSLRRTINELRNLELLSDTVKYSGAEFFLNAMTLIQGKIAILDCTFALRDYSCVPQRDVERDDPNTYLAAADLEFVRPILSSELAAAENLAPEVAESMIDLYVTARPPPHWKPPILASGHLSIWERLENISGILTSMAAPGFVARNFGLSSAEMASLMKAHQNFVNDRSR